MQSAQSAELQAQTAQFEESLAAGNPSASEQALNALARSVNPPQVGELIEPNALNALASDLTTTSQVQTALPQPTAIDAASQIELTDAPADADAAAQVAEAEAAEAAAAIESLEIFL